jgi:hypothetical protein
MKSSSLLAVLATLGALGCSSSESTSKTAPSTNDPLTGGSGFGSTADNGGGVDPASASCSDEAKLVYVLSLEGDLYSFAPADKKFTKIGPLSCSGGGDNDAAQLVPISMAVDRNAIAWVNMRDASNTTSSTGFMFKVDTKNAACTPTKISGGMGGMGFSTNNASTTDETLFVVGDGLMKVDFTNEQFVKVSDFLEPVDMELTGTGDGRLYGFLISSPLELAAIDKTTTAYTNRVNLAKVQTPLAPMFAFTFWGGDFYFYTATDYTNASTTDVSRYSPTDGSVSTYMSNIGFHIVGAGVSTCAPTTQPK